MSDVSIICLAIIIACTVVNISCMIVHAILWRAKE